MFQKRLSLFGLMFLGLGFMFGQKCSAQSIFRVSVWCLPGVGGSPPQPSPIYEPSPGVWRVRGPERDKLLNLGANHLFVCGNQNDEDAVVYMGDSLDAAPVRKEFKSTLKIVPAALQSPGSLYWPDTMSNREIKRKAWTAQLFTTNPCNNFQPTWRCSVRVGYELMYERHSSDPSRRDGVHSFFAAEEGCINKADHIAGINFMCDSSLVESMVQLGYIQTPGSPGSCNEQTTYYMAGRLKKADHLMSGNYVFNTTTDTSGAGLQSQIDLLVASLRDAARGIKDSSSGAKFWGIFQTQQSTYWGFRWPTKNELLCEVNLSLAHGAKGVSYYNYGALLTNQDEVGLLNESRNPTQQYGYAQSINTNYQGTGQSLVTIGGNFLNLTWKEGFSIHQNMTEPISSTYKLYDVTAKPPGGSNDAAAETYVEVGVLQSGSTNHYMVVNRRCTASETREVTMVFQSTANNAYRVTDVFTGCPTTYYPAGNTTFAYTLTLGPGQGKLLKLEDLGAWSGTITSNTTWSCAVVVNGDITVNSGTTLTVSPATTVKFASAKKLTINGKLVADSNDPTQRITFTGTTATPGFWNGIIINANSNVSTLRRCDVEYAANGMTITYTGNIDSVLVEKCKFRYTATPAF